MHSCDVLLAVPFNRRACAPARPAAPQIAQDVRQGRRPGVPSRDQLPTADAADAAFPGVITFVRLMRCAGRSRGRWWLARGAGAAAAAPCARLVPTPVTAHSTPLPAPCTCSECWAQAPGERPRFDAIVPRLRTLLELAARSRRPAEPARYRSLEDRPAWRF